MPNRPNGETFEVQAWRDLRALVKRVKYGELKIHVQDGIPIRVEEALRSIKLGVGEVP